MKSSLFLVAALSATASAAPNAPAPSPPPAPPARVMACQPSGDPLITIRHARVGKPSSDLTLYATGAWTYAETDEHGTPGRAASGCLAADPLKALARELAAAPWKLEVSPATCDALSNDSVIYTPHGKAAYTDEICASQILDDKSKAAIADIGKVLDAASAPKTPPCCKK